MIPIHDENPSKRFAVVNVSIILSCILIFFYQQILSDQNGMELIYSFGFIPVIFFGDMSLPTYLQLIPSELTILSSMFLHGGWMHLIGNMMYLWVFGDNIENYFGSLGYTLFYIICGVGAAILQAYINLESEIPMIGASGAISGVLGAYLVLYPKAKITVIIPIFYFVQTARLPAVIVLGAWFIIQLVSSMFQDSGGGVAFAAHVGGFLAGLIITLIIYFGGQFAKSDSKNI